ncbi:hypothetical protein [Streptomyces umbrinus]|uniref:hypothetical protein n=1 Tax=Streptomyces umbrinus TaxID=67370 RepID=UPI0033F51A29
MRKQCSDCLDDVRGSRHAGWETVALLAAMGHTGSVIAQRQVADKSNEIPAFAPLLDTADLTGSAGDMP